jgi:hypothetical protein
MQTKAVKLRQGVNLRTFSTIAAHQASLSTILSTHGSKIFSQQAVQSAGRSISRSFNQQTVQPADRPISN